MKRTLAWLLTLLMLLGSFNLAQAGPADTLTVGTTTAMSGSFMNGMFGSNTADIDVRRLLHGHSLIHWDADANTYLFDGTVVTNRQIIPVANGTEYRLTLNPNLKYSDGTPITAMDYAFSLLLNLAPEAQTLGASISGADHILGSAAYMAGTANALRGVHVPDPYTLILTIEDDHTPNYYALALLDITPLPISVIAPGCQVRSTYDGCLIEDIGGGDTLFTEALLRATLLDPATGYVTHPTVVSGPYTLVSYDDAASVAVFQRNPCYLGDAQGHKATIENIVYRLVKNEEALALLQNGDIDLMHKAMNPAVVKDGLALAESKTLKVREYARTGLGFINFSCELPTVGSAAVRQAIAHCFDKAAFIKNTLGDNGVAVDGYYGVGQWMVAQAGEAGLRDLRRYPLDVAAANDLLDRDGWTLNAAGIREKTIDGKTVTLELTLLYPEGNDAGLFLADEFTRSLAQAGIVLHTQAMPFTELLRVYYRQDARSAEMIYLASNFGTVYDPSDMFDPTDAYQGFDNRTGLADPHLHDLAVDLRQTPSGSNTVYCAKWIRLQEYWTEVLPALPIYSNTYYDFYTPALKGYQVTSEQTWAEAILGATLDR